MRKKLKSKKQQIQAESVPPKRLIRKYKKAQCAFIDQDGKECKLKAVGKSTLCRKHGGQVVIKENLLPDTHVANTSKYNPSTHPILFIDLSRSGLSEVEIAAEFNVSVTTIKHWAEQYEMFNSAYEIGAALHESWWLSQGKDGLKNTRFNTALFKFLTTNKLGYTEKVESRSLNMNIHGVLVTPAPLTEDEWENT